MSSTAIIALTDPRRPEAGTKRFKINGSELSTVLSKYYRRKIAGIYDEADRVYYPLGFIKLDSSYFSSRQRLSVVSAIDSDEYIHTEIGSSPVKKSRSPKEIASINKAKQIYFALCSNDEHAGEGISRDSMIKLLTTAFEFLFEVLGENEEVCTPSDLAISATSDCFEYIGDGFNRLSMAQFLSWYQAPQDIMNHELRSLMSQAIEIYLNPPPVNYGMDSNGSENDENKVFYEQNGVDNSHPSIEKGVGDEKIQVNQEEEEEAFEEIPLEAAIMEIKRYTGLYKYRVTDIIRFFLSQCDASNCLDRESFSILFQHLCVNEDKTSEDIDNFIDILFSVFDIDNNDYVNLVDFGNCLPLFCSGTPIEMSEVAFQLADHDQDGTLSPRELFLYLRSTTQFLCQLSSEISKVYDNQSPDEIAWIITVAAFAWIGKGIDASDFSYDHSLNTTTGSHCQERMTFKEFQNWYFHGNGLHTPTWRETDIPSSLNESFEEEENVEDPDSPYKLDSETSMHILTAKDILPLKMYSAVILSNFFCTLADGEGLLSESNFYHAFDKLIKTSRSPRSYTLNNARNHLAIDSAIAKIYRTYDPFSGGYVNVRDVLCGLLVFSGDYDISRAGAALNALEWTLRESGDVVTGRNMEYVLENDMAASVSSILKLVFIFNGTGDEERKSNVSAEYLAAHLTVEAYYRSNAKMISGDQYAIDPRVFRDWIAAVYNVIDANTFSRLSESNHDAFLKTVIEIATNMNKSLYEGDNEYQNYENEDNSYDDDEGETSFAPTDQSLAGDSITLASGQSANSISNCILEEVDNAKVLLGLSTVATEDFMEILGENAHSGAITLPELQECIECTTEVAGLDQSYRQQTRELVSDIFDCFDTEGLGTIPFAEIVCGLSVLTESSVGDKVAVSFLALDTNSSGAISVPDVEVFIKSILKVLILCSPTARGQLMKNCNASDRYPSVLVVNSSGEAAGYLDETELENMIIVVDRVAKDVLGLCFNSGLLNRTEDGYEGVDIDLMCKLVGEFCDMQQTIADNFYV